MVAVQECLRGYRFLFRSEAELQIQIAEVLTKARIGFEREFRLDQYSRLDFLCDGGVAIEVKLRGEGDLIRQIHRYMQDDRVKALLVVSDRLFELPEVFNSKLIGLERVRTF